MRPAFSPSVPDIWRQPEGFILLQRRFMFHLLNSKRMKTLVSKLVVIVALMCATSMNAQNARPSDRQLETALSKVNADEAVSVVKGMDELKRIEAQTPDAWLPVYYRTLFALQYAVRFPQDSYSTLFLDAVKMDVEALQSKEDADRSEALTLKGLYYTALIVQNPPVNGERYCVDAIIAYKSAIGVNPENPRARLLLYIFFDQMSKATGKPSMNGPEELATIRQLFAKEKPMGLQPAWGSNLMDFYGLK